MPSSPSSPKTTHFWVSTSPAQWQWINEAVAAQWNLATANCSVSHVQFDMVQSVKLAANCIHAFKQPRKMKSQNRYRISEHHMNI